MSLTATRTSPTPVVICMSTAGPKKGLHFRQHHGRMRQHVQHVEVGVRGARRNRKPNRTYRPRNRGVRGMSAEKSKSNIHSAPVPRSPRFRVELSAKRARGRHLETRGRGETHPDPAGRFSTFGGHAPDGTRGVRLTFNRRSLSRSEDAVLSTFLDIRHGRHEGFDRMPQFRPGHAHCTRFG